MEISFTAFVKGATKLRLFHCVWVSLSFILLGFLLSATSVHLTGPFPHIVGSVTGRKPSSNHVVPAPVDLYDRLNKEATDSEVTRGHQGPLDSSFDDGSGVRATRTNLDYTGWDTTVGCTNYRKKHLQRIGPRSSLSSLQNPKVENCTMLRKQHVSVLVKEWTWIPESLNNLYSCECGLTCLWTNSDVLVEKPDALLYESVSPPSKERKAGEPWRVYMDLEPGRNSAPSQDMFVSYHANDDLQVTYAGASFHMIRNYYISPVKHKDVLVYWSSSRCVDERQAIASELLGFLPHHSFGKCLNNMGGLNMISHMYPSCTRGSGAGEAWNQNLHCAMSYYKFVLAIENTILDSYVTEKLYYALDAGSVPIYFGAPNVLDFVPPNSIIEGNKFSSIQELAHYVKKLAADPVLYAEYHAWRRCGVMGTYGRTRAVSLDSFPCRLCAAVSKRGGRDA